MNTRTLILTAVASAALAVPVSQAAAMKSLELTEAHLGLAATRLGTDAGQHKATFIVEGIWPASAFEEKQAINTLIGDDPVPPNGGVAFHDTAVWAQPIGLTSPAAARK